MTKQAVQVPAKFGPSYKDEAGNPANYPEEMRTQLWPLCCGARIISGFKNVAQVTDEGLVEQIEATLKATPDHQVYAHEGMKPKLTFLTLNSGQMASAKIMNAVKKAGFVKFAEAKPRGSAQGFFMRDDSNTFKTVAA